MWGEVEGRNQALTVLYVVLGGPSVSRPVVTYCLLGAYASA